jgi:two-component system, LytTR family, sensor kinase
MTVEFCYLIFITADYYAINNFIVPRFLLEKKYAFFVSAIVLVIAISAWLRASVALQMNRHIFHAVATGFSTLYFNSLINISLWVLLITLGKMLTDRIQTQRQMELLEKERAKNELDYLKAQINPHALFNSLNTIYGHIDKNNQTARNTLLQFSELLRYQLYDCGTEKVDLGREIAYIGNYIHFQQLRKDDNLRVDFQVGDIDKQLKIAPLLLTVLIENAFKFVSNDADRENEIVIRISTQNHHLYSSFSNSRELQSVENRINSKGIGIANLKRRLELMYPGKYELTTRVGEFDYETHLNIDLA